MWRISRWLLSALLLFVLEMHCCASTCGHTTIESQIGGENNYDQTGAVCVPSAAMAVMDCQLYIGASSPATSGTIACGIYDSNGSGGEPDTLLCYGTSASWTKGAWNVITLSGCPTLSSGHTYYVAFNVSLGTIYEGDNSSGTNYYQAQTCCTMTNLTSPTSEAHTFSLYLDLTTAASSPTCTLALMGAGPC